MSTKKATKKAKKIQFVVTYELFHNDRKLNGKFTRVVGAPSAEIAEIHINYWIQYVSCGQLSTRNLKVAVGTKESIAKAKLVVSTARKARKEAAAKKAKRTPRAKKATAPAQADQTAEQLGA